MTTASAALPDLAPAAVEGVGRVLGAAVRDVTYCTSGAANHVFRITADERTFILKASKVAFGDLFACEAAGLDHLRATGTVLVPGVVAVSEDWLVLEDLGAETRSPAEADWYRVGQQLAGMHRVTADGFGYASDNYLGIWPQRNPWTDDWVDFYAEHRVLCHLDVGRNAEILDAADRRAIERLVEELGQGVPVEPPSLCHGDLWRNNLHLGSADEFYVIDPAVHFGLAEADLAATQMYERFPPAFYEGYRAVRPLAEDWTERLPLYQLKELVLMSAQFAHEESVAALKGITARYGAS